ncbi:MAG: phosphoribosyl-ATP diphosphatase [Planctomycetota bacterium]|nr:phosphoribosyl-ATP diphosphatase [Planctomycetota bacterium]
MNAAPSILAQVFETVLERQRTMPQHSYVASLLRGGTDAICCKLAEESGEAIKAAREEDGKRLASELADLYFHSLVLLAARGLTLADVEAELAKRHGISGLAEKAARKKKPRKK